MSREFYSHARLYDLMFPGGGLQLVDRLGDWSGSPFAADASLQLCICQSA